MKSVQSAHSRFVRWVTPLLLAGVVFTIPFDAHAARPKAPPGSIFVNAKNRADFIEVGKANRKKVLCRFQNVKNGIPVVGVLSKDKRLKKNVWKSYSRSIKELKQSRSLPRKKKKKQIAKLEALREQFTAQCTLLLGTPTVEPTPTGTPIVPTPGPTVTVTAAPAVDPILQDAGGPRPPFVPTPDSLGRSWASDDQNVIQSTSVFRFPPQQPLVATYPDEILRTQRYGERIEYHIPINDGLWDVVLFFAEVSAGPPGTNITGPGQRVFDIRIEGQTVATGVDIYQLAGGPYIQYSITFPNINMIDDNMNIELISTSGAPVALAVLEIRDPGGSVPHTIGTNFGFEVGSDGNDYTDPGTGITWQDDSPWVVGGTRLFRDFSTPIAGTPDGFLYQTQTYMWLGLPLSYRYALPNRSYNLTLGFAEVFPDVDVGQRIFNVNIEGQTVESNVDIASQAGLSTAIDKTYPLTLGDGELNFTLQPVVGNATLATVKIEPLNLGVSTFALTFGTVPGGSQSAPQTVTLRNDSEQQITVSGVTVIGPNASSFQVIATPPYIMNTAGTAAIQVVYAPPAGMSGSQTATLNIQTDDPSVVGGVYQIALSGS